MARKINEPAPPPLTRKHISRAERESQHRHQIVTGFGIVALLSLLVLGIGMVYSGFVEPRQVVATVDDVSITREQFYRRLNYERYRVYLVYKDARAQAEEGLADPQSSSFYYQIFQQQIDQLRQTYNFLPTRTLENMIEEELIVKEAAARNVTVTDAEVDEEIRRQQAQLAGDGAIIEADVAASATANAGATVTAESFTPTPSPTLEPTMTATATATRGRTSPTATARTTRGTATPAASATPTLEPTLTAGPTFTPAPTMTPNLFTEDRFTPAYTTFLNDLKAHTAFTEADYREVVRRSLLRTKLQASYAAEATVETTQEQIHVAHILVASEEEANAVLERLNNGESFEALAVELSTDPSAQQAAGDLGWISRDTVVAPFADAAFALTEPNQIGGPVQTDFGWHVIKLLEGSEQRPRDEAAIQAEKDATFTEWLSGQSASDRVKRPWYDDSSPVLPRDAFAREINTPLPTPLPMPTQPVVPTVEIDMTPLPGDATPVGDTTPAATPAGDATAPAVTPTP